MSAAIHRQKSNLLPGEHLFLFGRGKLTYLTQIRQFILDVKIYLFTYLRVVFFFSSTLESMKEAALSIYHQYLSEKANPKIILDEQIVKNLLERINDEPDEKLFDEIQAFIYCKLQVIIQKFYC